MKTGLQGRQLYFAYGSNLAVRQMRRRCPTSRALGPGYLDGWALAFGGRSATWGGAVADVVRSPESWVEGVLYEIEPQDLQALDAYEGYPWAYTRRRLWVTLPGGKRRVAHVYVQADYQGDALVSRRYFKLIYGAYRRRGFDTALLLRAKAEHDQAVAGRRETLHRVFVYGTLLTGEGNAGLLRGSELEGEATTAPNFELYSMGPFPAMVAGGRDAVRGEVYLVDDATLDRLDRLEGHPRFYVRTVIRMSDGDMVEAYLLDRDQVKGCERIASGDWRNRGGQLAWSWKEERNAYQAAG